MGAHDTLDDPGAAAPPAEGPRLAPSPPRPRHGRRRVETAQALVLEIQQLRGEVHRAAEAYGRRMDAQLAELLRHLQGGGKDGRPVVPGVKAAEGMLAAIRATEVRAAKGRAKDLVRLQELVAELTERLPPRAP